MWNLFAKLSFSISGLVLFTEQYVQDDSLISDTCCSVENILYSEQSKANLGSFYRHKCNFCGKYFPGPALLQQHIRVHTGEKPFVCIVCKKAFNQLENLKVHNRVHTGERPFQCQVCHKTFTTKGNLKIHSKVHTGERPFKCQLCQFSSIQYASLRRHIQAKHSSHSS